MWNKINTWITIINEQSINNQNISITMRSYYYYIHQPAPAPSPIISERSISFTGIFIVVPWVFQSWWIWREGVKNGIFLGISPKPATPPPQKKKNEKQK